MSTYLLTIIAGSAFLGSALLLAHLMCRFASSSPGNATFSIRRGGKLSGICALGCLLFLPPGSLPPLCNAAWGAVFWAVFFCASLLLDPGETQASDKDNGLPSGSLVPLLLAALALVGFYAWRYGLPGSPLNLGSFAAMPLWEILDAPGKAGFLLLFFGLFLRYPATDTVCAGGLFPARPLRRLAYFGLLTTIFFPRPLAIVFTPPGGAGVVADYICFWVSVLILIRIRARVDKRARKAPYPFLMAGLGAVLILASLHRSAGVFPPGAPF